MRALAKYIQKQLSLNTSTDAVISAIRRYETDKEDEKRFAKAMKIIGDAKISTKNHICNIWLVKDESVQEQLPKLFSLINYAQGDILRIIQAEEMLKIIVDSNKVAAVKELFPKNKIKRIEKNLAEINMRLDPVSAKVPGVLAILDTELANNGVNIEESMSCVPELIWFIDEKDILKAHKTFLGLTKGD